MTTNYVVLLHIIIILQLCPNVCMIPLFILFIVVPQVVFYSLTYSSNSDIYSNSTGIPGTTLYKNFTWYPGVLLKHPNLQPPPLTPADTCNFNITKGDYFTTNNEKSSPRARSYHLREGAYVLFPEQHKPTN